MASRHNSGVGDAVIRTNTYTIGNVRMCSLDSLRMIYAVQALGEQRGVTNSTRIDSSSEDYVSRWMLLCNHVSSSTRITNRNTGNVRCLSLLHAKTDFGLTEVQTCIASDALHSRQGKVHNEAVGLDYWMMFLPTPGTVAYPPTKLLSTHRMSLLGRNVA